MSSTPKIDGNEVIRKMFENKEIFLEKKKEVLNKKKDELQNKLNEKNRELDKQKKISANLGDTPETTDKQNEKKSIEQQKEVINEKIKYINEKIKDIDEKIKDIDEELKELESNKSSGKYPIKIKTDFIASNKANKKGLNINEIIFHIDDEMPYSFVDQIDFLISAINSQSSDLINKYYYKKYDKKVGPLYKGFDAKSVVLVEVKSDDNAAKIEPAKSPKIGGSLHIFVKHVKNTKNGKKNSLNKFSKIFSKKKIYKKNLPKNFSKKKYPKKFFKENLKEFFK